MAHEDPFSCLQVLRELATNQPDRVTIDGDVVTLCFIRHDGFGRQYIDEKRFSLMDFLSSAGCEINEILTTLTSCYYAASVAANTKRTVGTRAVKAQYIVTTIKALADRCGVKM